MLQPTNKDCRDNTDIFLQKKEVATQCTILAQG